MTYQTGLAARGCRTNLIALVLGLAMLDPAHGVLRAAGVPDLVEEQYNAQGLCSETNPCETNVKGAAILGGVLGGLLVWALISQAREAAKGAVAIPEPAWREVEPGVVHITYALLTSRFARLRVSVEAWDGDKSVIIRSVQGDVGLVPVGPDKTIRWDVAADHADVEFRALRFKIKARKP